jgi:hypothetical protein
VEPAPCGRRWWIVNVLSVSRLDRFLLALLILAALAAVVWWGPLSAWFAVRG